MMLIMRYQEGHKTEVRTRIVRAASKALRSHGLAGVSIPALMKRAGLTHGGFYAHFKDRDELVAEAVTAASRETAKQVFADDRQIDDVLSLYLSRAHLDRPSGGCVLAALGADAPRQPLPVRHAFGVAARGMLQLLEKKLHPARPHPQFSDDTLACASMMIGAVVLGRLVEDPALADRVLAAARTQPEQ